MTYGVFEPLAEPDRAMVGVLQQMTETLEGGGGPRRPQLDQLA